MGVVRMVLYAWECPLCNRVGPDTWERKASVALFKDHLAECPKRKQVDTSRHSSDGTDCSELCHHG